MITIVIINVVRVFCTFSLCTDAPSPQKKIDFFQGEGKDVKQAIADIPSDQTVEKKSCGKRMAES